ncbi:hypothetical protein L2Z53_00170 [Macrococcoides canis]|uniref:hypothetical protein n=1 Tax=Macrococcoides canis TaxID=1855823 RepID=UPI001F1FD048|nr:hypothetical protein [Macrococcus canis]UJS27810.1 hypothetical protein L2Z53_00170 [Macrococcus canis]
MPTVNTHYKMLLSCPSDLNKFYQLIKLRMETINKILISAYSSYIEVVHWTEDTYPASGDSPQNIINSQLVKESDFLVSMFWTKFGSPTEKYNSGTEQEIFEAIAEKKQVFLYFSNEPIPPNKIDSKEFEKINNFRESISDKAYYNTFNSENEFLDKLQIHIMAYFNDLRKKNENKKISSKLNIMSNNNGSTNSDFILKDFQNTDRILKERRDKIKSKMHDIMELMKLDSFEQNENLKSDSPSTFDSIQSAYRILQNDFDVETIEIHEEDKELIYDFACEIEFKIDEKFFELNGLKRRNFDNLLAGGNKYNYIGSSKSKEKFKYLQNIINEINIYNAEKNFFIGLNTHKYLSLCLTNYKGNYESDIDIKLYFPKGVLYSLEDIPFPGNEIIEIYEELPEQIFKPTTSSSIKEYPEYQFQPMLPHITSIYGNNKNITRDKYERNIRELEEYRIYREEKFDVLEVDYSEIKPNIALNFPSLIPIKMNGDENLVINYSINTRDSSDIIEGEITISS